MKWNKLIAAAVLLAVFAAVCLFFNNESKVTGLAVSNLDTTHCQVLASQLSLPFSEGSTFKVGDLFILNYEKSGKQNQAVLKIESATNPTSAGTVTLSIKEIFPESKSFSVQLTPQAGVTSGTLNFDGTAFRIVLTSNGYYIDLNANGKIGDIAFYPSEDTRKGSINLASLTPDQKIYFYNLHDKFCQSELDLDCDGLMPAIDPDCKFNASQKPVYCDKLFFAPTSTDVKIRSEDYVAFYDKNFNPEVYKVSISDSAVSFRRVEFVNNQWISSTNVINVNIGSQIPYTATINFPSWSSMAGVSRSLTLEQSSIIGGVSKYISGKNLLKLSSGTVEDFKEADCINGQDDDCDGLVDSADVDCLSDLDKDGYISPSDCNDTNSKINPGMTEIIGNGIDDDCNPLTKDQPGVSLPRLGNPAQVIPRYASINQPILAFNVMSATNQTYPQTCYYSSENGQVQCLTAAARLSSMLVGTQYSSLLKFKIQNPGDYIFYLSSGASVNPTTFIGNLSINLTQPARCIVNEKYGYSCGIMTTDDFYGSGAYFEISSKEDILAESTYAQLYEIVDNKLIPKTTLSLTRASVGKYDLFLPLPDCSQEKCSYIVEVSAKRESAYGGFLIYFDYGVTNIEVCDNKDNDGDQQVDENLTQSCGFGVCANGTQVCLSGKYSDCSSFNLSKPETCDKLDNDCDGKIDEDFDKDLDGFYNSTACSKNYTISELDCNDANPNIKPSANESCVDGIDNNCDGLIDTKDPNCANKTSGQILSLPPGCGDGNCTNGTENSATCCTDCGCPNTAQICSANKCEFKTNASVCGDNIRQSGEDCDGTDASSCPGLCSACKCPFIVGDAYCDKAAGETKLESPDDCKSNSLALILIILIIVAIGGVFLYLFFIQPELLSNLMNLHGIKGSDARVEDVDAFVMNGLSEGHDPDAIKDTLVKKGVDTKKVNKSLEESANKLSGLHGAATKFNVKVAAKDLVNLNQYINKMVVKGYTPAQIKTALISSGWSPKTVDILLAKNPKTMIKKSIDSKADATSALKEGHTLSQVKEKAKNIKL